jgi:hypothetical protein
MPAQALGLGALMKGGAIVFHLVVVADSSSRDAKVALVLQNAIVLGEGNCPLTNQRGNRRGFHASS